MKRLSFPIALAIAAGALATTANAAVDLDARDSVYEHMLMMSGAFEVGDGQSHVIANTKTDKVYRICVRTSRVKAPLKVTFDDKTADVVPGNCIDVEGMKVSVMPATTMGQDAVLIGRFHNVTR